MAAANSVIKQ